MHALVMELRLLGWVQMELQAEWQRRMTQGAREEGRVGGAQVATYRGKVDRVWQHGLFQALEAVGQRKAIQDTCMLANLIMVHAGADVNTL